MARRQEHGEEGDHQAEAERDIDALAPSAARAITARPCAVASGSERMASGSTARDRTCAATRAATTRSGA